MRSIRIIIVCFVFVLVAAQVYSQPSDFATEVTEIQGYFPGTGLEDDPQAALGKPSLKCRTGSSGSTVFRIKLVEPAFNLSDIGERVLVTIEEGEYIVVKFDHKVVDYPNNLFGQDVIVFGNSFFFIQGTAYIDDTTDIATRYLTASGGVYPGSIVVSVSQDGEAWHTFENGPWGDNFFPTQAYKWDRAAISWLDEEMDFTRPVEPNLASTDFGGISVADAIDLYDGSGGGTSFNLNDLPDYNDLSIDPETGYRWIQYVKLEGGAGIFSGGQVDAVSDVAACGDPTHPYPEGDINSDCRVNLLDYAEFALQWWTFDCGMCEGADLSDPPDQAVTIEDLMVISQNWLTCTYNCQ